MNGKLFEKECAECSRVALTAENDYMCITCRSKTITVPAMREDIRELIHIAINVWDGWVMVREMTDDPEHGWIEINLVESADMRGMSVHNRDRFAIWKHTGEIFPVGYDGAVEEVPIPRELFSAILTKNKSSI